MPTRLHRAPVHQEVQLTSEIMYYIPTLKRFARFVVYGLGRKHVRFFFVTPPSNVHLTYNCCRVPNRFGDMPPNRSAKSDARARVSPSLCGRATRGFTRRSLAVTFVTGRN